MTTSNAKRSRDHEASQWWANFRGMLSQEEMDVLGVSEDRGPSLCITRLLWAWHELHSEESKEKIKRSAFLDGLREALELIQAAPYGPQETYIELLRREIEKRGQP